MGRPGMGELILLLVVVLLLFGAKRLPDLSRSVGRSLRILKAETKALHDDDETPSDDASPGSPPAASKELTTGQAASPSPEQPAKAPVSADGQQPR